MPGPSPSRRKLPVAQLLLTREDINHRTRFLNLRNTITAVHELGAVPIVNENDTVSTDEIIKITFGDNDILAAMVTHAIRANLLVLMTVVDGLLDAAGQSRAPGGAPGAGQGAGAGRESRPGQGRHGLEAACGEDGHRERARRWWWPMGACPMC